MEIMASSGDALVTSTAADSESQETELMKSEFCCGCCREEKREEGKEMGE